MIEQTKDLESALHTYRKAWEAEKEKVTQLEAERDVYRKACERIRDKWVGGMAFHGTWEKQHHYIIGLAFCAIESLTEDAALSEQEKEDGC